MTTNARFPLNIDAVETTASVEIQPASNHQRFEVEPLIFLGAIPVAYIAGAAIVKLIKGR